MKRRLIPPTFFKRPTERVARELLGKYLVRRIRGKDRAHMITEVEVYDGFSDHASHASRGKTARTAPMFGKAGYWFVYFTYGFHWMLNVVTREEGYPAAILIRGVGGTRPVRDPRGSRGNHLEQFISNGINGPGRLTAKFRIDKSFNTLPVSKKSRLWIEDRGYRLRGEKIYPPKSASGGFRRIKKGPRVGVAYAGPYWARRHLRFWIETIPP